MYTIRNRGIQSIHGKGSLYFLAVDTKDRLEIQFIPDSIKDNRDAELGTMRIVGRNTPRYQVVGGETTMPLTLDFYADETSLKSVMAKCQWLKALTYTDGGKKPAQRVSLVFGEMFKDELWTVKSVHTTYTEFDPTQGFRPKAATVDILMCLDVDHNQTWDEILPAYVEGEPDGRNPLQLTAPNATQEDDEWLNVTNDNSFGAIMRRAAERLRIGNFEGI